MNPTPKFVLTLYVAVIDDATEQQIRQLRDALAQYYAGLSWVLNLVEVIEMPEKAIANDIFATPTLVRESPKPEVKVLSGLNAIPQMLSLISQVGPQ